MHVTSQHEATENASDQQTPALFRPFTLQNITFKNRIVVSPMCQYSSEDGFATDWHLVHLGSRAVGGAALVITEAAAVEARGRISPQDLGIYRDEHIEMLSRITQFIRAQGSIAGIQLAHAGRKASTYRPWSGAGELAVEDGRWPTIGPSAIRFAPNYPQPAELTIAEIAHVVQHFQQATERAIKAGFQVIELHAAHGYLIHEFLSPLSNTRADAYGGTLPQRMRLLLEIVDAVHAAMPEGLLLFVRVSSSDWAEGGLTIDDMVEVAQALKLHGVDLVDASSGGNIATARIPLQPGYQVPFAERMRHDAAIPTGAVGLITDPEQANTIIEQGQADLVFLARELLRDPYWPLHAAHALQHDVDWLPQYVRAKP